MGLNRARGIRGVIADDWQCFSPGTLIIPLLSSGQSSVCHNMANNAITNMILNPNLFKLLQSYV